MRAGSTAKCSRQVVLSGDLVKVGSRCIWANRQEESMCWRILGATPFHYPRYSCRLQKPLFEHIGATKSSGRTGKRQSPSPLLKVLRCSTALRSISTACFIRQIGAAVVVDFLQVLQQRNEERSLEELQLVVRQIAEHVSSEEAGAFIAQCFVSMRVEFVGEIDDVVFVPIRHKPRMPCRRCLVTRTSFPPAAGFAIGRRFVLTG